MNRETKKGKAPEPSCTERLRGLLKTEETSAFLEVTQPPQQQTAEISAALGSCVMHRGLCGAINVQDLATALTMPASAPHGLPWGTPEREPQPGREEPVLHAAWEAAKYSLSS